MSSKPGSGGFTAVYGEIKKSAKSWCGCNSTINRQAGYMDFEKSEKTNRNCFFSTLRPVYDPTQLRQILYRLQIQNPCKDYQLYAFTILKQVYLQPTRQQSKTCTG